MSEIYPSPQDFENQGTQNQQFQAQLADATLQHSLKCFLTATRTNIRPVFKEQLSQAKGPYWLPSPANGHTPAQQNDEQPRKDCVNAGTIPQSTEPKTKVKCSN